MKVYISGKIGEEIISDATREKFAKAEAKLKAEGFEVFNPCAEEWQMHLKVKYKKDKEAYQPYTDGGMPDFYTYCLLRDLRPCRSRMLSTCCPTSWSRRVQRRNMLSPSLRV